MQITDNEALRERVDDSVKRQKRFMHLIFFFLSLGMFLLFFILAAILLGTANLPPELVRGDEAPVTGAFILLGMGWFTTLVFQAVTLLTDFGVMDQSMRDRAIAREMARQLYEQTASGYEKPKRQAEDDAAQYAISEDGELIEVDEGSQQKAARG